MTYSEALIFLREVIATRLEMTLNGQSKKLPGVQIMEASSPLSEFILQHRLSNPEVIILLTALAPHLKPGFFQSIIHQYLPQGGDFPEFGGVKGKNHRGFLPTGETVLFILSGNDLDKRMEVMRYFDEGHIFAQKGILKIEDPEPGEPKMSGRLLMEEEYEDLFTTGKISKPRLSTNFPAERITTEMDWKDLILSKETLDGVKEIETWLQYNDVLLHDWGMHERVKPGYRALFYGPSGTGKTFTAVLLGKSTGRDVYRIDLSLVVSKYIGETEKNLSKLFDKAANKDWVLFFDEADSIFGKRTGVRDAHDKYANQEVSYLLQRLESHPGLVILASNLKSNIDTAFTRRFNLMVEFKNPERSERIALWRNYIPQATGLAKDVDIEEIARNFELTGAGIVNVIQRAGLQTIAKGKDTLERNDILEAIKKEYKKEEKLV